MNAYADNGTGAATASYIEWIGEVCGHQKKFDGIQAATGGDPKIAFGALFKSMDVVKRFGRTARFDYLAMLGRLDLAKIEPGLAYFSSATGPLRGARLLFANDVRAKLSAATLESWVAQLDSRLEIGTQALEDSLCNWQKSPNEFIRFRG